MSVRRPMGINSEVLKIKAETVIPRRGRSSLRGIAFFMCLYHPFKFLREKYILHGQKNQDKKIDNS